MGYLGATLRQVFTRAGGADVSLRDITITQMGNGARECGWRHAPEAHGGFWGFWKSQLVESRTRHRTRKVDFRGSHRPDEFVRYGRRTRCGGGDGKVIIERWCISFPYVETFNSKVIKGFVPELRSRYVFFVFRDSYVLCIYVMNILRPFHTYPYHGYATEWLEFELAYFGGSVQHFIQYSFHPHMCQSKLTSLFITIVVNLIHTLICTFAFSWTRLISDCLGMESFWEIHWLVVGVLWHINLCWLFNTKSIFMQIIGSISNNSI